MQSKTSKIKEALEEAFFGEDYYSYVRLLDGVIACRSLKEFRALKMDFKAEDAENIFAAANLKPDVRNVIDNNRAEQIFNQMKTVQATTTFI